MSGSGGQDQQIPHLRLVKPDDDSPTTINIAPVIAPEHAALPDPISDAALDALYDLPPQLKCVVADESSFLRWYLYASGKSKIPPIYHLWCGISLMGAALGNRVWFETFRDEKQYANLYVMLIGPSGTGKNRSIGRMHRLTKFMQQHEQDLLQAYRGKITPQGLISRLGKKKKVKSTPQNIWIITPELAMAVGSGGKSWDWVTHMTELADGATDLQDTTRNAGHYKVEDLCVNWLSGTNLKWLVKSINTEDVLGGFSARLCIVPAARPKSRSGRIVYPRDRDEINSWLIEYLAALTWSNGAITESPDAAMVFDWWCQNRDEPVDELLHPFWDRGPERVRQFSMVLCMADQYRTEISYNDVLNAISLWEWLLEQWKVILGDLQGNSPARDNMDAVLGYVSSGGDKGVLVSALVRFASNRGIMKPDLKPLMETLLERGDVKLMPIGRDGGRRYLRTGGGNV